MKKSDSLDFDRISKYYQQVSKSGFFQDVSVKLWNDLGMDEVFLRIDYTLTKYGEQFLYYSLRLVKQGPLVNEGLESTIEIFEKSPGFESFLKSKLEILAKNDSYFLCNLFQRETSKNPWYIFLFYILSGLSVISVVSAFFIQWLAFPAILVVTSNFIIHYWSKLTVSLESRTFGQLGEMLAISQTILKESKKQQIFLPKQPEIEKVGRLIFKASMLKPRIKGFSELAELAGYILEVIKAAFLIETLLYYSLLKDIREKRSVIEDNFEYVAYLDFALSIAQLRNSDPSITVPKESNSLQIDGKGMFHPLISDAIRNSIHIDKNGVLITGANMSGKSTFLRIIGLNCLLAQTINCAFASELTLPKLKIYSSIQTFDELESDKSYFYSEAETIKGMFSVQNEQDFNLVLIDEIFKGTNSRERLVISSEVLKQLAIENSIVIATTHDLELVHGLPDFMFFYFTGEDVAGKYQYDFQLRSGVLDSTNAVFVLRDMGYPNELLGKIRDRLDG
ncbi:MutS-related protein [Algoriphagus aquimarinus]|uniref:MutS-related protein n=1 Tax=Algoriphagus aquimarinus TaxID=237018 RepID=UPI0030DD1F5A|tara:strand:+ start:55265 stop:56785 length:1521 start_codon:yes stop_codon:yes gene_type:complete